MQEWLIVLAFIASCASAYFAGYHDGKVRILRAWGKAIGELIDELEEDAGDGND